MRDLALLGKTRLHIAFRADSVAALAAYDATRVALRQLVESRLISEGLAAIAAGDVVKVQSFRLSREGLALGRSQVPWSDVVGLRPLRRTLKPPIGDLMIWTSDGRGGAKPFADTLGTVALSDHPVRLPPLRRLKTTDHRHGRVVRPFLGALL
jgi:hypothetical protein